MSGFPGDFSEPLIGENEELVAEAIKQDEERLGRSLTADEKKYIELFLTDGDCERFYEFAREHPEINL
jgi:hypothetical protein